MATESQGRILEGHGYSPLIGRKALTDQQYREHIKLTADKAKVQLDSDDDRVVNIPGSGAWVKVWVWVREKDVK